MPPRLPALLSAVFLWGAALGLVWTPAAAAAVVDAAVHAEAEDDCLECPACDHPAGDGHFAGDEAPPDAQAPCDDGCPDRDCAPGCADCACCPGAAPGVTPAASVAGAPGVAPAGAFDAPPAVPSRAPALLFRPPRRDR